MAGGKETPRQKMIGMMYLVLTALLALNVSKSILDAFVTIDEQALIQNTNLVQSINGVGSRISFLKNDPQSRKTATEIMPYYIAVQKLSNTFDDTIHNQLNRLFVKAGEESNGNWFKKGGNQITTYKELDSMETKDNYDIPSAFYSGNDPESEANLRGKALRTDLMKYRDKLIVLIADSIKDDKSIWHTLDAKKMSNFENDPLKFKAYLKNDKHPNQTTLFDIYQVLTKSDTIIQHHEKKEWHFARFYHQPMVAVVSTLTSLRNDIRTAEEKAVKMLLSKIDKPMMNINKIEAKALANAQYFNVGDKIELEIGIIAYDSTKKYQAKYRTSKSGDFSNIADSGKFTLSAGSPGNKIVEGVLMVEIAGQLEPKPFSFEYTVGKPSATVASPELNVMYRGYDNKIMAVASGYPPNEVKISCSGCKSFSKGSKGLYVAKVGGGKKATVLVKASGKTIGKQEFRIMPLPKPQPYFAGKTYGNKSIKSGLLKQATLLTAKLADSPLNVKFSVRGFTMDVLVNGKIISDKSGNGKLTGKMRNMVKNAKKGSKVYIYDVLFAGPDGKRKPIGGLTFKVL